MALAVAAALSLATAVAAAQHGGDSQSPATPQVKPRFLTNHFPDRPSLAPVASIPLVPLGFTAPSSNYLGARNTFVSLDFIDEDQLLFTFRVPGLIHRDLKTGAESNEREIRAVVLKLPQGTVRGRSVVDGARPACATCGRLRTAIFFCATATVSSKATPH